MINNEEVIKSDQNFSSEVQKPEQNRENLYRDILYREAVSLLTQYLPETLPQESTETFTGTAPQYLGKFKNKHCVVLEKDTDLDPVVQMLEEFLRERN